MSVARVLIIEDDTAIRSVVRAAVEADGGRVFEAATVQAGLALAAAECPDLIVLDLGLPDGDGRAVCSALRASGLVPILVLSARGGETDKAELLDGGADDYLTKPFSTIELRARIRAQLRRARRADPPRDPANYVTHGLVVHFEARVVARDGVEVHLTPTEWSLLKALTHHAGRTVTHAQLFSRVWGREYGDAQKYLRVYIAQLRRKIEQDPLRPALIVTEPGVGYRFAAPRDP